LTLLQTTPSDPTDAAESDDLLLVPLEKSEFELELEARIQQNPVVAWII